MRIQRSMPGAGEDGTPCRSDRRICMGIAGIAIEVKSPTPRLRLQVQGAAEKFLIDGPRPDVRVRAGWGDRFGEPRGEKLFDSGGLWQLYRDDGSFHFRFNSPALGSEPYKVAFFRPDFTVGEVRLNGRILDDGLPADPLEYPLDELLVLNLLAQGRGVEVHACGVAGADGEGYLFLGQSGAGKTTMAKLWQEEEGWAILNDDRIVLRKVGEEIWMFGTPWHGDARISNPASARLKRLFFLRHGQKNEATRLWASRSVARLYSCAFLPFYSAEALDFSLWFFEEVATRVPCHELSFVPERSAVEFVRRS